MGRDSGGKGEITLAVDVTDAYDKESGQLVHPRKAVVLSIEGMKAGIFGQFTPALRPGVWLVSPTSFS